MKKILMLGGSTQQIVAIEAAKKLGYYTVLCDYLTDNPGQFHADKFYLVSTIDRDAVLKVAIDEKVDAVIAYASDPAAPTAAYVAEKLALPGNPLWAVETLCNKDRFRQFLAENGLNAPKAEGFSNKGEVLQNINAFKLPIIVKPVDSSGSKGATVVRELGYVEKAIDFAFEYSRSHRVIVEEFIEKKHPYLIGGDIFVEDGKIILYGLLNCHRDQNVNPLVPVGKSYPLELESNDMKNVQDTLQKMVDALGFKAGAMNVELIVDKNGMVWPIDVGPRNGGNMIPDLLGMIYGVDVIEMAVKAAVGMPIGVSVSDNQVFYATHNLHSDKNGVFKEVYLSDWIKPYVEKMVVYKKNGDVVEFFSNAGHAVGIVFMKFDSREKMRGLLADINNHIKVILQ